MPRLTRKLGRGPRAGAQETIVPPPPVDTVDLRGVEIDLREEWVTPTLRTAISEGWYELPEALILEATLREDDRVLEAGCGIGYLATICSRITGGAVRGYDANPAMVEVARRTLERSRASASVSAGVLERDPVAAETAFYVREEFWVSSRVPSEDATQISVPVLDFAQAVGEHEASYLVIDIEGGETELLSGPLPSCVRAICVETHLEVNAQSAITAMLVSILSQGFNLILDRIRPPVLYLER